MACGCGYYRDPLTGVCGDCVEICQNVGKDCGRRCPCFQDMQHLNQVISDLATKSLWLCRGYAIVAVVCFLLGLGVMYLWYRCKSKPFGDNLPSEDEDGTKMLTPNGNRRPSNIAFVAVPTCEDVKETNGQTLEKQDEGAPVNDSLQNC